MEAEITLLPLYPRTVREVISNKSARVVTATRALCFYLPKNLFLFTKNVIRGKLHTEKMIFFQIVNGAVLLVRCRRLLRIADEDIRNPGFWLYFIAVTGGIEQSQLCGL